MQGYLSPGFALNCQLMIQHSKVRILLQALLAGLSGVLCYLSFPPVDLGLLAWVSLVPLFLALRSTTWPWQGGLVGLVYGVVFFALLLQYISMFGYLPWLALAVFQGFFFAIFGWVVVYLTRVSSPITAAGAGAAAWVQVEYLRSHIGPLSFTFGNLAYSQHSLLPIIQIASLLGAGAVTFLIVLSNATLAQILVQLRRPPAEPGARRQRAVMGSLGATYALIGLVYVGGVVVLRMAHRSPDEAQGIRVGLVQGNVDLHTPVAAENGARCRVTYSQLSRDLPDGLDLVVWPETALPVTLNREPVYLRVVEQTAGQLQAHLLTGALEQSASGGTYNTAYLFNPAGEIVDRYHKIDLVMFGEYVPWRGRLKFLSGYPIRGFDFVPGDERQTMSVGDARVGVLICFEAIFAQPARELCGQGADLLVFLTSDVWAAGTPELLQHSYTAPLRAVEARKYVVRSATMGQSALISPYGQVLRDIPVATAGAVVGEVYPRPGLSVYHRGGDVPLVALCLLLWIAAMFSRKFPDRMT